MKLYLCEAHDVRVEIAYLGELGSVTEVGDVGSLIAAPTAGRAKTLFYQYQCKEGTSLEFTDVRVRCVAAGVDCEEGFDHGYEYSDNYGVMTSDEIERMLEGK